MGRFGKAVSAALLAVLILIAARCAVNPVTGRSELMLIPESTEIEIGQATDASVREEYGLYGDEEVNAYVRGIGERMVPTTHRPQLPYHFAVLDTPVENAFAAPGGFIYITRGLLALINDEAALAVILGHELGHVNARHTARAMSRQLLLMGGLILGSALSDDIARLAPFAMVGLQVLFLKYSRDDEYQADSLGVLYSRRAGYMPGQVVPLFRSFLRLEEKSGSGLPNFLSTHPLTTSRIDEIQKMLVPEDDRQLVRRNDYLARINGLVYGDNPRQGYVEGNAFYHPEMRFRTAVPKGWTVQNTPKQVMFVPKKADAALILTEEDSGQDLTSYMKGKLGAVSSDMQVSELARNQVQINGLAGLRGRYSVRPKPASDASSDQAAAKPMTVEIGCLKKSGQIFTFLGTAESSKYGSYERDISQIVGSFGAVSDPAVLNRRPRTLSVVTASNGGTLRAFLKAQNVPAKQWDSLSLLNGLGLDDTMERGRRVKLIR